MFVLKYCATREEENEKKITLAHTVFEILGVNWRYNKKIFSKCTTARNIKQRITIRKMNIKIYGITFLPINSLYVSYFSSVREEL